MVHAILVADASRARLFSAENHPRHLKLERWWDNPDGRALSQELSRHMPGRVQKAGSPGTRSGLAPRTPAQESAVERFARRLATELQYETFTKDYDTISIIAPSYLIVELSALLSRTVRSRLHGTLGKDLTHLSDVEILPYVEQLLATTAVVG
jgi:protein required for attachment to host cells